MVSFKHSMKQRLLLTLLIVIALVAFAFFTISSLQESPRPTASVADFLSPATPMADKFIFVGQYSGQFTEDELRAMANQYPYVMISKFHDTYNILGSHYAARKLVAYNSLIKVFPYFNVSVHYVETEKNPEFASSTIKDAWYLRDTSGNKIKLLRGSRIDGYYMDLSNPEYRGYVENIVASWMQAAPYAGIFFDRADLLGVGSDADSWRTRIGQNKIDAWNAGFRQLFPETKRLLGDKLIIYNGFSPSPKRVNRNLSIMKFADAGFNEEFCTTLPYGESKGAFQTKNVMLEDLSIMETYRTKILFEQVNYPTKIDATEKALLGRYCFGAFLLGKQPGSSFFKFSPQGYGSLGKHAVGIIQSNPPEMSVDLGLPRGNFILQGDLGYRAFANGYVYVNLNDSTSKRVALPADLILMNGGVAGAQYPSGSWYTIPPRDAALFLYTPNSSLPSQPPTCTLTSSSSITALSWTTNHATSFSIDQGIGTVQSVAGATSGSIAIAPVAPTTYTGTALGDGGSATCSVTVQPSLSPSCTLSAQPQTVSAGDPVTLSWNIMGSAKKAFIDNGVGDISHLSPPSTIVFPKKSTSYSLRALGDGGVGACDILVTVTDAPSLNSRSQPPSCLSLTHTILRGFRDNTTAGEVSLLQEYLSKDPTLYPEGLVTGYYGPLTQSAVRAFQIRHSLGTARTLGLGEVGPLTRTKIHDLTCAIIPN